MVEEEREQQAIEVEDKRKQNIGKLYERHKNGYNEGFDEGYIAGFDQSIFCQHFRTIDEGTEAEYEYNAGKEIK